MASGRHVSQRMTDVETYVYTSSRLAEAAAGTASAISQDQGLFLLEFIPVLVSSVILSLVFGVRRVPRAVGGETGMQSGM